MATVFPTAEATSLVAPGLGKGLSFSSLSGPGRVFGPDSQKTWPEPGPGRFPGLDFKSGPGSGFKIKFFSGSKKPGFCKSGSKISGPGARPLPSSSY